MKRLLIIFSALLMLTAGPRFAFAANQPQNIGYAKTDNPFQLFSRTAAQVLLLTPDAAGQLLYCSDCTAGNVCVSTGTGVGAWVLVSTAATQISTLCR